MPKIIARLNKKTGELKLETKGFSGDACLNNADIKALTEKLGMTGPPEMTSEYYQQEESTDTQQEQGAG